MTEPTHYRLKETGERISVRRETERRVVRELFGPGVRVSPRQMKRLKRLKRAQEKQG